LPVVFKTEDDALRQLSAPGFGEAWEALFLQCPWAAPDQSLEFVTTWYEIYRERFSPVLVSESSRDGMLIGVLPLALSRDNGRLVVAGAHQAEYQAWISLPTDRGAFITRVLLVLRQEFPRQTLVFKYLPPELPLDFLTQNITLKRYCKVRRYRRPLLVLDERDLMGSLRKKSNKSRINRFKALGKMTFERVTTALEAEPLMAEIATQCDLRQGAIHDSLPFQDDPLKKLFYKTLLDKALLHFTVLKVGSSVLSAHLGLIDKHKHRVQVGVFSHSVSHARHSPGKLHILMLGMRLLKDGVSVLDLTPPGGDWKERFASTHDEVFTLTMYGGRKHLWSAGIRMTAGASVRKALEVLGLPPSTFIAAVEKAWRFSGFGLVGNLKRFWFHRRPVRLYRYEFVPDQQLADATPVMSRDRLGDLLAFEPKQTWSTDRQGFLASACKRLEKGYHCYTYIDHGSLVYCGWLVERYEVALSLDLSPRFQIPKGSAFLVDCNINPQAREIGLFESCVKQMLHDARLVPGTHYAYVSVPADDGPALRAIDKLGFVYQGSPVWALKSDLPEGEAA